MMKILDDSRANHLPTGHVIVGEIPDPPPEKGEIATFAGYGARHFGYEVVVHDDGTATVFLWNA